MLQKINSVFFLLLISIICTKAFAKETPLITADLGGSTGINNGNTYQEMNLGVNVNFTDWLTWRNSAFQKSGSKIKTISGLDSSLRLVLGTRSNEGSFQFFIGPGYRWSSSSENSTAFAEAGLGGQYKGLGLSGGAKYFKYTKDRFDIDDVKMNPEDVTYFISLSGSASFGK